MKTALFLMALGVFPAFGGGRVAPIRLYFHFQQDPPDAVLESIQEELSNIMVPVGLDLGEKRAQCRLPLRRGVSLQCGPKGRLRHLAHLDPQPLLGTPDLNGVG